MQDNEVVHTKWGVNFHLPQLTEQRPGEWANAQGWDTHKDPPVPRGPELPSNQAWGW